MRSARSCPTSSTSWKRLRGCSHATAKARRLERQPLRNLDCRDHHGYCGAIREAPAHDDSKIRWRQAHRVGPQRSASGLNDRVLALAIGKTQQEIAAACKGARPNHVGAAIARHKRAGRIEERDGKLYATQPMATEQRATG
jgi:hypothetical protein